MNANSGTVTAFARLERGIVVPAVVTLLYGYLYVLLTNEDAALLVGSIGLFAILAAIMFITRGVNWYAANGGTTLTSSSPEC